MPAMITGKLKVAESSWGIQGRKQRARQTDAQYIDSKLNASDDCNRDRYGKGKRSHENMVIGVNATTRVKASTLQRNHYLRHENMVKKGFFVTSVKLRATIKNIQNLVKDETGISVHVEKAEAKI